MDNPFNIINPQFNGDNSQEINSSECKEDTLERIQQLIKENKIILFMKGNAQMPQCGFSANSIQILNQFNKKYATYDILQDPSLRELIKDFSQWPTFPQLYVNGELVGGNDIITELNQQGELENLISQVK
jgi:monothiol glutaredoxin